MVELLEAANAHTSYVAAGTGVGTSGVRDWLGSNAVPLILFVVALVIGLGAVKRDAGKVITIGALSIFMLLFVGLAGSAAAQESLSTMLMGWFGLGGAA